MERGAMRYEIQSMGHGLYQVFDRLMAHRVVEGLTLDEAQDELDRRENEKPMPDESAAGLAVRQTALIQRYLRRLSTEEKGTAGAQLLSDAVMVFSVSHDKIRELENQCRN